MATSLLTSPLGQKVTAYKAKKTLKGVKKWCSAAFEGVIWVAVIISFFLIGAGGIINFIPMGIKYLNYPIGNFMNMPIGIYALVYDALFILPVIPLPAFIWRKIPVIKLFQSNFLVRGLTMGILSLGLCLTLATAFGAVLMIMACIGYIIAYCFGFEPKWLSEEASEQAEYQKIEESEYRIVEDTDTSSKKPMEEVAEDVDW